MPNRSIYLFKAMAALALLQLTIGAAVLVWDGQTRILWPLGAGVLVILIAQYQHRGNRKF